MAKKNVMMEIVQNNKNLLKIKNKKTNFICYTLIDFTTKLLLNQLTICDHY